MMNGFRDSKGRFEKGYVSYNKGKTQTNFDREDWTEYFQNKRGGTE